MKTQPQTTNRLDYLDAVRAFALLLGIVFHASLSFMPIYIGWAVMDVSTSSLVSIFVLISHSFRMELFFLIAGFFGHMTFHKRGTVSFLKTRFIRIAIPFIVGWFILRPLVVSGWIMGTASMQGDVDILAGLSQAFQTLKSLPNGIFVGSHLWFLYYLLIITTSLLFIRLVLRTLPQLNHLLYSLADRSLSRIGQSSSSAAIFALPTAVGIYFMSAWGMDTPDKSLIPHLPTYLVYLGCFLIGWLLHRQPNVLDKLSRLTPVRVINIFGSAAFTIYLSKYESDPGFAYYDQIHIAYSFSYSMLMWSLVFGSIGLFRVVFKKPNKIVRYFADASYWLYLIHLPIVLWLQIAFAELPLHWSVKLPAISILTVAIAILIYDIAIRPSPIGKILNGARKPSILHSLVEEGNTTTRRYADKPSGL